MSALRHLLVVTGDHALADPTKHAGGYSEDDLALHRAMVEALESLHRFELTVCTSHATLRDTLARARPDLVFNLCDTGFGNVATQELHVPALLEMEGVPYTGAPPAAMVLAYDKPILGMLARSLGLRTPAEHVLDDDAARSAVGYPAFVKPAAADGSVGINRGSIVRDDAELEAQLAWLRGAVPGARVLVQEYLPGPEYGLALLGNPGRLEALPMLEVDYSALPRELPPILAFESKTGPENPYDAVGIKPASLPSNVTERLVAEAARLFERVGFRDYARFDFRAAADGSIALMEANPNPAWSREAKLARMAAFGGVGYPALLERIVDSAWARLGA